MNGLNELKIDLGEEYKELTMFYLSTLPEKVKSEIAEKVRVIKHGDESFGNGHSHKGEITIGPAPSSTYFLELLGHELAHEINVEEKFGYLVGNDLFKEHSLCDEFSRYLLYGKSKYIMEFEKEYGKRDPEVLKELQERIKRNDDKIEQKLKLFMDEEIIRRFFNRNARFLR